MHRKSSFPTKEELQEFIENLHGKVSRREIARAFHIKNNERALLRATLKGLEKEGKLHKSRSSYTTSSVPEVLTAIIQSVTSEGDLIAVPTENDYKSAKIYVSEKKQRGRKISLGIGEKILVRLRPLKSPAKFEGLILKVLGKDFEKVFGFVRPSKSGYVLLPTNRKINKLIPINASTRLKIKEGDFISGKIKNARGKSGLFEPETVISHESNPHILSTIAIHTQGLKESFSSLSKDLAIKAKLPPLEGREDLRNIPLVTIDGEDARDFDDAVFAQPDENGWHLIVAIADVAYYVRPEDALDKEALERGNSTYFPDLVLPMLPEELSNGLCSLKPKEDRACLAVHLWIDPQGILRKYHFVRGLMCSQARLTYTQVQKALDGKDTDLSQDFIDRVLRPLFKAYKCLQLAREERGTLDFDRDEPKIKINAEGEPTEIDINERHESHRLIEEFMITANVAAARTLEEGNAPCIYRVHEPPNPLKVEDLRESLKGLGLNLPKSQAIQPKMFTHILKKAAGSPFDHLVNELVLRTQSRASYAPRNLGHFGLSLTRYAHFTSPIRRYADLIVHRSLISKLKLGEGGLSPSCSFERLEEISTHISETERNSDRAAWDTIERFMALYLSNDLNKQFLGRIDGVSRHGLFVEFEEIGATGFVPLRTLTDDIYIQDPVHHKLIGKYSGNTYTLGDTLEVILKEANPLTGSIILLIPQKPPINKKERPRKRKFN